MRRRARTALAILAALVIACLAILALALTTGAHQGASRAGSAATPSDAEPAAVPAPRIGPGVASAHAPGAPASLPPNYYSAAQARAFAAAGLAEDGQPQALARLDPAARAALDAMRAELARQQPLVGEAAHAGAGAASGGAGAPGAPATLDLTHIDHGITGTSGGEVITGSQVWALAELDPARGRLDIDNRSGSAYIIRLYGADFGSVRLNGGLVVPGRAYAVGTAAEITGAAAVAVHIRPAASATTIYPGPLLPQGNG